MATLIVLTYPPQADQANAYEPKGHGLRYDWRFLVQNVDSEATLTTLGRGTEQLISQVIVESAVKDLLSSIEGSVVLVVVPRSVQIGAASAYCVVSRRQQTKGTRRAKLVAGLKVGLIACLPCIKQMSSDFHTA